MRKPTRWSPKVSPSRVIGLMIKTMNTLDLEPDFDRHARRRPQCG